MKLLIRPLSLISLLVIGFSVFADAPYKPSDIQAALNQHDFPTADREIQAVLVSSPNSAVAHYWAAKVLIDEHHAGQALVEVQKAQALPAPHFSDPGKAAQFKENLDKASVDLQKTISDEESALAHPKTTTTTTTHEVRAIRPAVMTSHARYTNVWPIIAGMAILLVLYFLLKWLFRAKPSAPTAEAPNWARGSAAPSSGAVSSFRGDDPYYGLGGPTPAPMRSTGFAMQPPAAAPVASGHSTGSLVGAGLGGLAAGMLLEEALHDHNGNGVNNGGFGGNASGFGSSSFGGGGVEEIDTTTTTTTTYDDAPVQQDYQQDDNDLSSSGTDDSFGSSDSGGGDFGGGGDDSF